MTTLETAKSTVVQVGNKGGRGFIVSAGEWRYIVTAAHCRPRFRYPKPHLANSIGELTFPKIIGPLGSKERTIWAELCTLSLIDDVAVFAAPDGQELSDRCDEYETFTRAAITIGKPPAVIPPYQWDATPGTAAFVLSLEGEWQRCTVHNGGRFLRITNQRDNHIRGGMSGSPIITETGAAIGLISTGDGAMNPSLMDCLPPWLLHKLDDVGRHAA